MTFRSTFVALGALSLLVGATAAQARPHHRHGHYRPHPRFHPHHPHHPQHPHFRDHRR